MKVLSNYLGEVDYQSESVVRFVAPILGFEERREFVLIENDNRELPFDFLQAVDDADLTFITTSPYLFVEDYEFNIEDGVAKDLEAETPDDIAVYSLVVIPERIEETTINLKAPILVNMKNKKALQIILDEEYPFKHQIFKREVNPTKE